MADIANSINNIDLASSANNSNSSHTSDAPIPNNADASNGLNTADGVGNVANQQLREHRAAITLAIIECLLGVAECGVGVRQGDERAKKAGAKAIQKGVGSARVVMERKDIAEGVVEGQLYRVVKLVILLQEQRFWRSVWNNLKHYSLRFWILCIHPWMLVVLSWFGHVERIAQE